MYTDGNPEIQRAEIQVNIEQQVHLNDKIVFVLKPGLIFFLFVFLILFKDDNILYFNFIGSNHFTSAKVREVVNLTIAKVVNYERKEVNGKVSFTLPLDENPVEIDRKLVYKVGFKLTKKNNLKATLLKHLSSYVI